MQEIAERDKGGNKMTYIQVHMWGINRCLVGHPSDCVDYGFI